MSILLNLHNKLKKIWFIVHFFLKSFRFRFRYRYFFVPLHPLLKTA